jgi:hypothetical protein
MNRKQNLNDSVPLARNWLEEMDQQGSITTQPISTPTSWLDEMEGRTRPQSLLDPYINKVSETISSIPGAQQVLSTIAPALDVLSRPSYAVNRFIAEYQKPEGKLLDAVASAFTELFTTDPKQRYKLSYSDVIRQKDPEFAYNNPTLTQILGFIGDVALDPTTYLGFGTLTKGFKTSAGLLNKPATSLLKEYTEQISRKIFTVDDTGKVIELVQSLPKVTKKADKTKKLAEAFLKRVEGSAVVDDAGELIPLYRGTDDVFKKIKDKRGIKGLYFTTLPEVADIYAQETGSSVVKVYSNAKKLLDLNAEPTEDLIKISERLGLPVEVGATTEDIVNGIRNKFGSSGSLEPQNQLIAELKKAGFQGMKFISDDGGIPHQQYLIFSERHIIPAYTSKGLIASKQVKEFEQSLKPLAKSVVRDDKGELLKVYHGTASTEDFTVFQTSGFSERSVIESGAGAYFTNQPSYAARFAEGTNARIIPAYLNIEKPHKFDLPITHTQNSSIIKELKRIEPNIDPYNIPSVKTSNDLLTLLANVYWQKGIASTENEGIELATNLLKKNGFDGIINGDSSGFREYIVFNDKQIYNSITNKPIAQGLPSYSKNPLARQAHITKELTEKGYFDAVAERRKEITKLLDIFDPTGTAPKTLAEEEVMKELLSQAGREMSNRPLDNLWESEVIERVTERMNKVLTLNPQIANKVLAPKALYLKVGLPFTQQKEVAKIFGTEYLGQRIKALSKFIDANKDKSGLTGILSNIAFQTGRVFSRDFAIPEEIIERRNQIENVYGSVTQSMLYTARKAFQLPEESRIKITQAMQWADSETRKLEEIRKASVLPAFRTLTDGEGAQIFQQGAEKFKLTPEEFNIMSRMQRDYKEIALLEQRANLLKSELINYSARGYAITKDADDMSLITRGKYVITGLPTPYLASSKQRKYLTIEEAERAGLTPELDAAILYTHRVIQSQRALATKQFQDAIIDFYGGYKTFGQTAHTGILPTAVLEEGPIPKHVIDDIRMIGQSIYPPGMNSSSRQILRAVDKLQGLWKRGATTVRPTFGTKQIVSNTFQAAMVLGIKAFKSFDPRAAIDAAITLVRGGKPLDELPSFLRSWVTRNTGSIPDSILAGRVILRKHFDDVINNDFLEQYQLTTDFGQKFTGKEIVQLMQENGIIRGFDSTGEAFTTKLKEQLSRESVSHARVVGVLGKVWNHASFIEDYSRAMLFINGIAMGYSPTEATKLVNKALFDYQRGLSNIERNLIRRVLPFYTFQRFAIPFVLKSTLQQPGNVATLNKLMATMEKLLISGEELTPAEVDIFNQKGQNYLLEQPRLLAGFDKNGTATLNILNNFTPWDVLNLFTYDKEGNLDIARTAEKSVLAALTPFLKIPLTVALNRDFFTGRTIQEVSKIPGNLENNIGLVLPQWAKDLIGFEARQHLVTGRTYTYINPFLSYYSMQFIPALREYIKPMTEVDKQNGSWLTAPLHYAMNLIDPVQRIEYDFKTQEQNQLLNLERDLRDIQTNLVFAKIRGDGQGKDTSYEFEDNLARLQRYLLALDEKNKTRANFSVRGTGLQGLVDEDNPQPIEPPSIQETLQR